MSDAATRGPVAEPNEPEPGAGLLRSSGIVAVGTLLSRVTGLVRTSMLAWALGVAGVGASYALANSTPNMIYDLLLGGILTATLVPALVGNRERGDDAGTDAILTVATVVLFVITIATVVLAPLIVALYAVLAEGGADAYTPSEQDLAVALLRLFAPQILFYGLTTLGSALLNAHRRFAAAAFAPVLNNVWMIVLLVAVKRALGTQTDAAAITDDVGLVLLLGLGTTLGIAVMAMVLWPAIVRAKLVWRWHFDLDNPAVRQVARLSGWTVGYVVANQVTLFVIIGLAGGANAIWGFAYQFFQLPYGVFTASVMTTFTPELASLHDRGERRRFNERFLQGLRLVVLVLLPATVTFILLARPIVDLLFVRGNFTPADGLVTASTVAAFAWGLLGFSLYLYVLRAFYARKDTRTPFLINLAENAINLVLAVWLGSERGLNLGVEGLAWSWSLAYTIAAVGAFLILRRTTGPFGIRLAAATTAPIARMLVATVVMTIVVTVLARLLPESGLGALVAVVIAGGLGTAVYLGVCLALGTSEVRDVRRMILRR
jgi:putative peptidoglycan lipid II flippase